MEMSQHDIKYIPRTTIKDQALADFISEFSYQPEGELSLLKANTLEEVKQHKPKLDELWHWTLYVDDSSNEKGAGVGLLLKIPEGNPITAIIRFEFAASNNEAEYEALLARIRLAKEMGAKSIKIYSDSQLIVHQITRKYSTKEDRMASCLQLVKSELEQFRSFIVLQIAREKNSIADALAHLTSTMDQEKADSIPIKFLPRPNTSAP
ncbi:uncharacterized protein LOC116118402 [Pistacia vera]|uniref:uncharacterized protein LOC116118402 n=1 Tax=Pistacia vera TaxID=55513 RepID=UPI001263D9A5|nr:uncharacterized protein LOC116118402 [Pistacia vera]